MDSRNFQSHIIEIGNRLKLYRVNMGLSQQDLAEKTGISVRSISRFEQGNSVQLEILVKILIALQLQDNLELLIPDQKQRPSYYLEDTEIKNKRVKNKKNVKAKFKWGDEQ